MAEWLQKNLKFPRLTFLGIGFLLGLFIALVSGWQFTTRIEEVEKTNKGIVGSNKFPLPSNYQQFL